LWYSLLPQGNAHEGYPDFMSLHGGCDVQRGEKWVANLWIHNKMWGRGKVEATPEDAPYVDESGSNAAYDRFVQTRLGQIAPPNPDELPSLPPGNPLDNLETQLERLTALKAEVEQQIAKMKGAGGSGAGGSGAAKKTEL